jgi:type IV pilus assembly protein PilW
MMARQVPERSRRPRRSRQCGVTLLELLIAMGVALVVVLCATAAFIGGKQLFTADAEAQAVEDTLRFAGFVVKGIVRQAGYADYAPDHVAADGAAGLPGSPPSSDDLADLNVVGARNARVTGGNPGHGTHDSQGVNGSDSLRIRFFGRSRTDGDGTQPDGTMVDCMGFPQPGAQRAWSFFYVGKAADGEPQLYCKYRGDSDGSFRAESLARGIEVFNVVYAYDGNGDGVPEHWLDAQQLEARAPSPAQAPAEWRKVTGLRIGMVARSTRDGGWARSADEVLHPLGTGFPNVRFKPPADGRLRRVATFTVMLRNAGKGPAP